MWKILRFVSVSWALISLSVLIFWVWISWTWSGQNTLISISLFILWLFCMFGVVYASTKSGYYFELLYIFASIATIIMLIYLEWKRPILLLSILNNVLILIFYRISVHLIAFKDK